MATKKKPGPSKPVSKQTPQKVKKAVPVKKVAAASKKSAPTKSNTKKAVAKPVQKKTAIKKPAPKPIAKKAAAPAKPLTKLLPKPTAKPVKPAPKSTVTAQKITQTPMAKKSEEKKTAPKAAEKPVNLSNKAVAKNPKDIKVPPPKPVVMPKILTKTSRKYAPDFTKSVLDQPKSDPGAPIVRYNDSELLEFRELIQRKLEAAKKELNYLQGLITRKDEMGGDESENRYMTMEDGSLSMEREQLSQMASRQITFIDHLEKAIMRIENKTYGICRVTGKLIDKARLRAVPHATLSIEAKMGIVK